MWPTVDHVYKKAFPHGSPEAKKAGKPLAGGYSLVIWNIKSDLDHLAKAFGLEHYSSKTPCALCPCTADETQPRTIWYNNFQDNASWMRLVYSHEQWRGMTTSPFLPIPVALFISCQHRSGRAACHAPGHFHVLPRLSPVAPVL